jgi:amidase
MIRRHFLGAFAASAFGAEVAAELTIADLHAAFHSGRLTAHAAAAGYLERIRARDSSLRSVIELDPGAPEVVRDLDREWKAGRRRGPLHGVPVLIKDNIETAGPMQTTAGSLALEGHIASNDAPLVARLRKAGAVILGKTNLSEWANFRSTRSISGWSGRGGQTRNPYAPERNPSGSSSGSAVAVAANLCAVAVGTETDGSVTSPAAINGIVGIKPTVGLIPGEGIIPISHTQDTAGPMARTVADAALLLGALSGRDFTSSLDGNGLRGTRLGLARAYFNHAPAIVSLIEEQIGAMKRAGAIIVDPADLRGPRDFRRPEFEVMLYEFKAGLNAYLSRVSPKLPVHSLAQLIEFNEKNREREMPYFGQEILLRAEKKGPLSEKAYVDALAACRRLSRSEGIDAVLRKHDLQAIIAPTTGVAWKIDTEKRDQYPPDCTTPAAVAGYPHITVPAGFVEGLPVGLSFFGAANSEPALIRIAYAYEQLTRARKPPRIP